MSENMKFLLILLILLAACEEKGVDNHSRHRRLHPEKRTLDPVTESHVYNWENLLASGDLLMGVTANHFAQLHEAISAGVFNPNTVLSKAEINRIGRALCTSSPTDADIGRRRLERTITIAPEFLTMTDAQGQHLLDWLIALKRKDLIASVQSMSPPKTEAPATESHWWSWWNWR